MQTRSDEFKKLIKSAESLESALGSNLCLINEKDEDGMTLLHHAAGIGLYLGSTSASEILNVLFNTPGIDFNITDVRGNTPLHLAAYYSMDRVTCNFVFPSYITEAVKHKFDFSKLGDEGKSVLQMAALNFYDRARRSTNVKHILTNAPDPGLNVLSTSGATAFFYSLCKGNFEDAEALMNAGANPILFGSLDQDPMQKIEEFLKMFTDALTQGEDEDYHEFINAKIAQLNELKQRVLSSVSAKSYGEIRKNARILAQGQRDVHTLFHWLPDETLAKVAGHTKTADAHTQSEAEKIARTHLDKPTKK
jgi:ankyrin repeat protein